MDEVRLGALGQTFSLQLSLPGRGREGTAGACWVLGVIWRV